MPPHSTLIFTDGASKGNPGPGGWGAVVADGEKVCELGGGEKRTTNNRMELVAAIHALSVLHNPKSPIHIYADSSYLIGGITKWVHGWKQNGWRTKAKEDVLNRDLWEKLDELSSRLNITWRKVAGHADTPGNARADEIASAFGDGSAPKLFSGPRSTYPLNLSRIGAREGSSKSGKAYSYVSLVDGVVKTHKTWDECKKRVDGKSGVRFRKATTLEEEFQIIQDFKK